MTADRYLEACRVILAKPISADLAAEKIRALNFDRPLALLTVKEFCSVHGIDRSTLYRWRRAGRIAAIKTPAGLRIEDAPFCNIPQVEARGS